MSEKEDSYRGETCGSYFYEDKCVDVYVWIWKKDMDGT